MNGNASTVEPPGKKASCQTKSKLAKQVLKYIDCYKCKRQMHTCCVLKKHRNINYDKKRIF